MLVLVANSESKKDDLVREIKKIPAVDNRAFLCKSVSITVCKIDIYVSEMPEDVNTAIEDIEETDGIVVKNPKIFNLEKWVAGNIREIIKDVVGDTVCEIEILEEADPLEVDLLETST